MKPAIVVESVSTPGIGSPDNDTSGSTPTASGARRPRRDSPTAKYWYWLQEQTETAEAEIERELHPEPTEV